MTKKHKKTLAAKKAAGGVKPKRSKYAMKIRRRAREATAKGLPPNTPYPIIWRA